MSLEFVFYRIKGPMSYGILSNAEN